MTQDWFLPGTGKAKQPSAVRKIAPQWLDGEVITAKVRLNYPAMPKAPTEAKSNWVMGH